MAPGVGVSGPVGRIEGVGAEGGLDPVVRPIVFAVIAVVGAKAIPIDLVEPVVIVAVGRVEGGGVVDILLKTRVAIAVGRRGTWRAPQTERDTDLRLRMSPEDHAAPSRLPARPTLLEGAAEPRPATRRMAPLSHEETSRLGDSGQQALLDRLSEEPFVRACLGHFEVMRRRVPATRGRVHT